MRANRRSCVRIPCRTWHSVGGTWERNGNRFFERGKRQGGEEDNLGRESRWQFKARKRLNAEDAENKELTEKSKREMAGWASGERLVDLFGFAGHVVHEEILDEGVGAGKHEGVDHDAGALAFVYFLEGLADDERIEAESVFVNAAVFEGESGGLSVGDHDDLAHIFLLAEKDALGHAQAFASVGVIRADLDAGEFAEGDFFCGVVEEDEAERVAGILRANEMGEGHGDAFGGRETVFAIENHAVAAIEKDHGGAGAVVFALMDHEVRVGHFDGNLCAFAADGIEERGADVHVERVAEFVRARDTPGFDAGGEVAGVVAAKAAAAERAEQILQGFEAEKIDGLVSDFKTHFVLAVLRLAELAARGSLWRRRDLRRLLRINETFVGEAFGEFIEEILHRMAVHGAGILEHFAEFVAHGVFREQVALLQGAEDGFPQGFHGALGVHLGDAVELRFEAALEEEIAEAFDEFFEVDGVGWFAGVFAVADEFHGRGLKKLKVES